MAQIILDNFHLGGISDTKYSGIANSSYKLIGMNIHEEPGILKVQQDVVNDVASGDPITGEIVAITPTGVGKTYFWGDGGDVWERNTSGVYDKITDGDPLNPTAGSNEVLDAVVFGDKIYYSMAQRLGEWTIGSAWNTRDDDFATLTAEDEYHPLKVIANDLYVGNVSDVAKVDSSGTFTADKLSLESKYTIQSLGELRDNLLIGTITEGTTAGTFSGFSKLFNWDTVSPTFNKETEVDEFGINAFMNFFGSVIVQAGDKGMLYSYDGVNLQRYKRIPGDWSGTKTAKVNKNAVSSYNSLPVFGLSNVSGNPTEQGVYTFGGYDAKYPNVFSLDYFSSSTAGVPKASASIGAVERIGTDLVFSSKYATAGVIEKIDTTKKYTGAYLTTQVIDVNREIHKTMKVRVCYRSLPDDTSITMNTSVNNNNADFSVAKTIALVDHSNMNYLEAQFNIIKANTVQLKFSFFRDESNPNNTPEIEKIIIDLL